MPDPDFHTEPPRFWPATELPPYSYVSGHFPHPTRDPAGHMAGHVASQPNPPDSVLWRDCRDYLLAIDLFNYGYYWEAHEAWESLWHAAERRGLLADFFKGLIKLAAAGVKAREGRPDGVVRHARRAGELFSACLDKLTNQPEAATKFKADSIMGLSLRELQGVATRLAQAPTHWERRYPLPAVEVVFDFRLLPECDQYP